nr:aminotransferase class I/II-fold pyridoxal phosphate-dependent enzyme [Hespellia stercorisuis]
MHAVADHGIFGYSIQDEAPRYYEAICGWFARRRNWKIKKEEIVYINGTVEAMRQVICAVTNPGDGVIIQKPVYGPFSGAIEYTKRTLVNNSLVEKADGYYEMDFEDLEQKCKDPRNKLMFLCSPHNPVGSSQSRISGFLISARPIAVRCCCPPDNWLGSLCWCS